MGQRTGLGGHEARIGPRSVTTSCVALESSLATLSRRELRTVLPTPQMSWELRMDGQPVSTLCGSRKSLGCRGLRHLGPDGRGKTGASSLTSAPAREVTPLPGGPDSPSLWLRRSSGAECSGRRSHARGPRLWVRHTPRRNGQAPASLSLSAPPPLSPKRGSQGMTRGESPRPQEGL